MANGSVLYRDIFEQKGPLLYMLHYAAYLLSHTTFTGIYYVEISACFVYLLFSYKTVRLLSDVDNIDFLFLMPIISILTYSSVSFQGGDSAEELCLPFFAYCFYAGAYAVKNGKKTGLVHCIIIGISAGVALWFKFTLLGFFIGLIIAFVFIYVRKKWFRDLFYSAAAIISGIIICSLPVIIYFAKNNAFDYLFEVYFYDNLFLYRNDSVPFIGSIINLITGVGTFFINNPFGFVCIISGAAYLAYNRLKAVTNKKISCSENDHSENKFLLIYYCTVFVVTFSFVYVGGRFYSYYPFILNVFSPVGACALYIWIKKKLLKNNRKKAVTVCIVPAIISFVLSPNLSLIGCARDAMPQYRFAEIICRKDSPTLLNYGFLDGGFYTAADITPDCRFFCELNIPYDEMYRTQDEYIRTGKADFVVTKDEQLESTLYRQVDECEFPYGNGISKYYLYEKVS